MGILIHDKKAYITIQEVITYLEGFKIDIETERATCLRQVNEIKSLHPKIKEMSINMTNLDYDFFNSSVDNIVRDLKLHLTKSVI